LSGTERHGRLLAALAASRPCFDTRVVMTLARRGSGREDRHSPGFAGFTALGFVPELLVVEKQLFPGGESKFGTAVDAG
jgi:hypothetical protein